MDMKRNPIKMQIAIRKEMNLYGASLKESSLLKSKKIMIKTYAGILPGA